MEAAKNYSFGEFNIPHIPHNTAISHVKIRKKFNTIIVKMKAISFSFKFIEVPILI